MDEELIELAEMIRATGDILADELSVLNHTVGLSGRARDALTDWDGLSFKLRAALKNERPVAEGDAPNPLSSTSTGSGR